MLNVVADICIGRFLFVFLFFQKIRGRKPRSLAARSPRALNSFELLPVVQAGEQIRNYLHIFIAGMIQAGQP